VRAAGRSFDKSASSGCISHSAVAADSCSIAACLTRIGATLRFVRLMRQQCGYFLAVNLGRMLR
jgi:hypothetical protein